MFPRALATCKFRDKITNKGRSHNNPKSVKHALTSCATSAFIDFCKDFHPSFFAKAIHKGKIAVCINTCKSKMR